MSSVLIKNGNIVDVVNEISYVGNVAIDNGVITKISKDEVEESYDTVIDATGLTVAPGLVDVHVHFRDPGLTYKEDIYTGAKASARGGFTTVIMMANTKPVIDNEDTLTYCVNKGKETAINVLSSATITEGMKGQKLVDFDKLRALGAAGFTDDGLPIMDEAVVRAALRKSKELGVPVSFHEEDPSLIANNGVNRGKASEHFGIGGSPRDAEITMIKRDLDIAVETDGIINIQHISSKEGVELVREAKKKSSNVHAEATPHHFTLTEDAVIEHKTYAKMNPPLRTNEDRRAIVEGLKDGTIDIIATDHAPHSEEEKAKAITDAPSGIIGLETSLSLAITTLVHKEGLSLPSVMKKMSYNPAKMYGLETGEIKEGLPADIVVFDENAKVKYTQYESKAVNTPFTGMELDGEVKYTICGGKIVWSN